MSEDKLAGQGDVAETQLASLRAENEGLRSQLEASSEPEPTGDGARSAASVTLVVLGVAALAAGVFAAWFQTTIVDEDRYVETFAPLPKNEAVAVYLSERLADGLVFDGEVAGHVEQLLPPNLEFLAVPVTQGIHTLTANAAESVVVSDVFSGIWQFSLRASHATTSAVLSTGGRISIDLNEAAEEVVSALEDRGVSLLSDREFALPEIVLFQNDQIEQAAGVLDVINTLGWLVPLIALILIVAALWVSPNRRRTTANIGFGTAIGLLATLVIVRLVRAGALADIDDETQRAAAEAIWDTTLRFYVQSMWALIVLALILGIAAWMTGPSERAGHTRAWWRETISRRQGLDATTPTSGVVGAIASWRRPLQWGAVALGLLFLLAGPEASGWSVSITALVVLAVIVAIEVVSGPRRPSAPAEKAEETAARSGNG